MNSVDVAISIVTIFVMKVVRAGLTAVTTFLSITLLIAVGIAFIATLREGMKAQQEIGQWNLEHADPFTFGLINTYW